VAAGSAPCTAGITVLLPSLRGQRIPPAQIDMHIKSSEGCTLTLVTRPGQSQRPFKSVSNPLCWCTLRRTGLGGLVTHHALVASRCCCRCSGDSASHLHRSTRTSSPVRAARKA
jgi:hypothetical protein